MSPGEASRPGAFRLLVLVNSPNIGSAVVSLPALKALQQHFGPDAALFILHANHASQRPVAMDILAAGVAVAGFLPQHGTSLWGRARLWWAVRRAHFDALAFLDPLRLNQRNCWQYRLFFRTAGIRRQIGLHLRQARGPDAEGRYPHVAQMRLEQVARGGIDISRAGEVTPPLLCLPASVRQQAAEWLRARRLHPERPLLAICPGARSPANHWGLDRFIDLGRRLAQLERYELIVCGGPAENAMGAELLAAWGQGINAAGALSLLASAAIFQASAFLIGLDTGSTHLAAAVGTRCISLQGGRTFPGNWDPLGPGHMVLRYAVACSGCRLTECPLSRHPCMRGITVEQVWQAVLAMQERCCAAPGGAAGT